MRPEYSAIPEREPVEIAKRKPLTRVREGMETYADRLLAKTDVGSASDCWIWRGAKKAKGYGHMQFQSGWTGAHRVSYMAFVGEILPGRHVCHACDTPSCVNPSHLWLGTARDNIRDMFAKGRGAPGIQRGEQNGGAKLSAADVVAIRAEPKRYGSGLDLARRYGVTAVRISTIRAGKGWDGI